MNYHFVEWVGLSYYMTTNLQTMVKSQTIFGYVGIYTAHQAAWLTTSDTSTTWRSQLCPLSVEKCRMVWITCLGLSSSHVSSPLLPVPKG